MEKEVIAVRYLEYLKKGETSKKKLTIKVYRPYELVEGQVSFPFSKGAAGCEVKLEGLETDYFDLVTYGADVLQALQLAADVEPVLRRVNKRYELYFPDGEPYFE